MMNSFDDFTSFNNNLVQKNYGSLLENPLMSTLSSPVTHVSSSASQKPITPLAVAHQQQSPSNVQKPTTPSATQLPSNLQKRKAVDDDDDGDSDERVAPPESDVLRLYREENSKQFYASLTNPSPLWYQEFYWGHLQRWPISPDVNGTIILLVVRVAVNKRVLRVQTCIGRLNDALLYKVKGITLYLCGVEQHTVIRKYLTDRDASLGTAYDELCTLVRKKFENKSSDELLAHAIEGAQWGQKVYHTDKKKRHEESALRAKRAAERYSVTLPAATATPLSDQEIENIDDEKVCVVCFEQRRQICAVPCGHISMCKSCAVPVAECPVCRTKMTQKIQFIVS